MRLRQAKKLYRLMPWHPRHPSIRVASRKLRIIVARWGGGWVFIVGWAAREKWL